jgi:archaellum biogenesis ATPase FlaH
VIQFPETAASEWKIVADAANADDELRKKIERDTLVERELERLRVRHLATTTFQQELDEDLTPTLDMATLASYKSSPTPPSDLIEGVVKANGLCIMLGPSGSGKSTTVLQMCHSLMTGNDWLGQPAQQISGSVGIVSYDMDGAMVMDWMSGFPNVDPHAVSVVNAYKRGNPLGVPVLRAQIVAAWKAMSTEVVVVDSFSASFFGHDQNDAASVMAHYRDLQLFALTEVEARALIIIVHSTDSNPEKARGSTVHHDVADTIVVQHTVPTGERKLRMVKYRAALGQKEMDPVIIGAPDNVTHLVDVDPGAMTLAGMHLPARLGAQAFPALPPATTAPDTDSDRVEEDTL